MTGGGTSGHVLPALAVADGLVAAGHHPETIMYIGAQRGVETAMLPQTPFPHTFFDVVGLQRSITRRNIGFVPKMASSTRAAIKMFREDRPSVVVSVGGYASMPAVFAARRLKIPIVVVSYDRTPGRASRLAARSATASAVAFENSPLPRATLTGAPIRQAILDVERSSDRRIAARQLLGIPQDRFMIVVMGGSLGSGVLNEAIANYVATHELDTQLAVRQIAGERFADQIDRFEPVGPGVLHQVIAYESDMPTVYEACDLLIGRGGASTVHEVATTGVPAILVPWAGSADNHQVDNVNWLVEVGGAVVVTEDQLEDLPDAIQRLRQNSGLRTALRLAAAERGMVHRSGALADLIERVAVTSEPS